MSAATAPSLPKVHASIRVPWIVVFAMAAGTLLAVLLSGLVLFEIFYSIRVLPGVSVWGIDLGGQTVEQAAATLDTQLAARFDHTPIDLSDGQSSWAPTPGDLGLRIDSQATAQAAFAIGRDDLNAHFNVLMNGLDQSPQVTFDPAVARAYFEQLAAQLNREPVEAGIQFDGLTPTATAPQAGRVLNVDSALATLAGMARTLNFARIDLPFDTRAPYIVDASAVAARLQNVLSSNFTLKLADPTTGDPSSWDLTPEQLLALIKVQPSADGTQLEFGFDADRLRAGLTNLAGQLNRDPQNARFVFNDDTRQLDLIQPAVIGRSLDIEATMQTMAEALQRGEHQALLAINSTPPEFGDDVTAQQLGITELIATGQTYYAGSSSERVTNIDVAAARFHGIIVKPGETFSFDNSLGDVSLDTGFAEALIIANGRTIQGVGGGVCQVSTTAFRAAFNAGFPIIERWPHAYRVGWYERGFGPGLDATVYSPVVDFKFTNDTPYHLLIETYANNVLGRLTFKFYSTSDGRQVDISDPIVENVVPHGPDILEDDPTLPLGTTTQVDYAVDGADVTVKRTVTRDGQVISNDTIFTHYLPWQAIYKIGTGPTQ
jgi:vancomycin resistance protein YoaR